MNDSNDSKLKEMQNAIESFDPVLLRVLERGMTERVVIPGDTVPLILDKDGNPDTRSLEERQKDAVRNLRYMANRLRALRAVMLKAEDPRARLLYRTIVHNVDTRRIELVVEPRDAQIKSLLDKVDFKPDKANESALDELAEALKP